jgi:hypothetical protein
LCPSFQRARARTSNLTHTPHPQPAVAVTTFFGALVAAFFAVNVGLWWYANAGGAGARGAGAGGRGRAKKAASKKKMRREAMRRGAMQVLGD